MGRDEEIPPLSDESQWSWQLFKARLDKLHDEHVSADWSPDAYVHDTVALLSWRSGKSQKWVRNWQWEQQEKEIQAVRAATGAEPFEDR
jgi:hypothetical protein